MTTTQKYKNHRITNSTLIGIFIVGFLIGETCGHFIFQVKTGDVIKFTMVYSSEKDSWISATQDAFYSYWEQKCIDDPTLKPIALDFQPYGSGDSLIGLLNGEIKPTIWSPASNIWVPILNTKWQQLTLKDNLIAPNFTRLIYSPVVIATWEKFYSEHPFNGIQDLYQMALNSSIEMKMAHTDARESNSGFMTSVMIASSILQKNPANITVQDLSNQTVIDYMRTLESKVIFYGKSTGFLGKYLRDNGPSDLQIAFLYENLIKDYSANAQDKWGEKIIAVYPEEGSLFSDHPFCILDADWVTPEQKFVAEEYLNFLSSSDIIREAIHVGFRPLNASLLSNPEFHSIYLESFNENNGVTSDPFKIFELIAPTDGKVISRIPDLWLLTRNTV